MVARVVLGLGKEATCRTLVVLVVCSKLFFCCPVFSKVKPWRPFPLFAGDVCVVQAFVNPGGCLHQEVYASESSLVSGLMDAAFFLRLCVVAATHFQSSLYVATVKDSDGLPGPFLPASSVVFFSDPANLPSGYRV